MGNAMKKLALVAVASAALATPALASDHINVNVVLKNTSFVSQGGRNGSADVALVAQGALATVQARHPRRPSSSTRRRPRADRQLVFLDRNYAALIGGGALPRGPGRRFADLVALEESTAACGPEPARSGERPVSGDPDATLSRRPPRSRRCCGRLRCNRRRLGRGGKQCVDQRSQPSRGNARSSPLGRMPGRRAE